MATENIIDPLDIEIDGGKDDETIIEIAKKRFKLAEDSEIQQRIDQIDDQNFLAGNQWPEDIKQDRARDQRPCLTINRLPQQLKQVTNEQRQNRPSIKVNPVDDKADIETAKVYQGLIRHIEYNSNADVAYDTAFEGSAGKGLGYFRIITDFCDPMSFDQEILIKRVRNSHSVYLDPTYQEPDGSDANWGFIFENMPVEDYKSQFKKSKILESHDWSDAVRTSDAWLTQSTVRVAEYFYKTFEDTKIHQLSDGSVVEDDDLEKALAQPQQDPNAQPLKAVASRMTVLPAIKWVKTNGVELLEKSDWAGRWIPIIPVLGDEIDIDGRRILQGIIRNAKDAQRMYNYWNSAATETIALAPKAPFIGYAGQFEGFEHKWNNSNTKNYPYLEINPKMVNGAPAPFPQRQQYEPPVQAISQAMMHAADDIKATTGIYDASLGNRSNENSGVAIQRRNTQAQTGNFHFVDNLSRSIRHCGRILIDLIPSIYDTARAQRILGEDGTPEIVQLNKIFREKGEDKIYRLGHGQYDCAVTTGPNFATRRQESAASMMEFMKAIPQAAMLISDLAARNMDWPGSDQIADRLEKSQPPGMVEKKDEDQAIPPEVKQVLDQQKQTIDQLTQHLHMQQNEIDQKKMELDSKERIAMAQIQADIEINLAKLGSQAAALQLEHEVAVIDKQLEAVQMAQASETEIESTPAAQPAQIQPPIGGQSPSQPMGSN